ncbi:MAG: hypothetical protein ACI81T_000786 [Bacteroidia bacterium]|jgi:hypothetical protein
MKNKNYRHKAFFALILFLSSLAIFSSCKDCSPVGQPTLIMDFFRFDSLQAFNSKIELDTQYITVSGEGIDSTLTAQADSSSYSLPLNPATTESRFIFNAGNGDFDTLDLTYLVETIVEGPDCGVYNEFDNIAVRFSTFDSVIVVKSKVEDGDLLHLEIFESESP